MDRKIEMFNHVVIVFSIMGLLAAVFIRIAWEKGSPNDSPSKFFSR